VAAFDVGPRSCKSRPRCSGFRRQKIFLRVTLPLSRLGLAVASASPGCALLANSAQSSSTGVLSFRHAGAMWVNLQKFWIARQ